MQNPPRPIPHGPGHAGGGGGGNPPPTSLGQNQQDALALMTATLQAWGLGMLVKDLKALIIKGDTSPDTLTLALSQTDAYKKRFDPVNAPRRAAGIAELRPADIVAMEEQYHNIAQAYGVSSTAFGRDAVDKLLAGDVSAAELQTRMQAYHDQYELAPDYVKRLWGQYFGTKGDALAVISDPSLATSVIQDRAQQVGIGGAAGANGFNIGQSRAQQFQEAGITIDQARQAYQSIARVMPTDQSIAQRFGTTFNQKQEENDLLLNDAAAAQKRQTLYSEEESLFRPTTTADSDALSVSQNY